MKGKIFLGILMLFLVLGMVNVFAIADAVADTASTNEDTAVIVNVLQNDVGTGTLSITATTSPTSGTTVISSATSITYTPSSNFKGTDSFTYTITDSADASTDTATVSITVISVNDQPVISVADSFSTAVDDTLTFTVSATDVDNNVLTLSATTLPAGATFVTQTGTGTVSQTFTWTPGNDDTGSNIVTFSVNDGTVTVTKDVEIVVGPEDAVCEDGPKGDLRFSLSTGDLDENEYLPGEIIDLEVDVDNDGSKDLDVIVEATLFDVSEDDELDEFESDEEEIKDGDDNQFDVELEVPLNGDLDEDGEFILFVKAYEDGDEDTNCWEDSLDVDIEREDNDVIIESVTLSPSSAQPGDSVELVVDVLNVGGNDQDDVVIEVIGNTLGIDEMSETFNLDRANDNDDEFTERFLITIPSSATEGSHNINVRVLDEDGDVFDVDRDPSRSHDPEEFVTLTVTGEGTGPILGGADGEISLTQTSLEAKVGDSFNVPVIVRNTGSESATFTVETSVTPSTGWSVHGVQSVVLDAGQETTVFPTLTASNVQAGNYNVLVSLKTGSNTIDSESLSVTVKGTGTEPVTGGAVTYFPTRLGEGTLTTVLLIIGNIALVVIIIYFIRLIFKRR